MSKVDWSSFTMHLTVVECEKWKDSGLPVMERLIAAAYCRRRANGHSRFDPGALREGLELAHAADLSHLIERAVLEERLAAGSCANCLILMGVTGGFGGSPRARCGVRAQHARVAETHRAKLDGSKQSRAEVRAGKSKEWRTDQIMKTVTMTTQVTDEEWAVIEALRAEKAAQERRVQMRLVEDRRAQGKLDRPEDLT